MLTTIAQAAIAREDYIHPEKLYKDLIFCPSGTRITKSKSAKLKELAGGKSIRKKYCAGLVVGESKTNGILVMAHGFESFTNITIKGFGKLDLDG